MALSSPKSPNVIPNSRLEYSPCSSELTSSCSTLLTPPSTSTSSPLNSKGIFLPNNFKYYNNHLNKSQFNTILINCSVNLLNILYPSLDFNKLNIKFFIVEILRRSKTSIQSLQVTCFYLFKLIKLSNDKEKEIPTCPKQLFLGLVIIASKFNQDCNYSFKSWLKICGCNNNEDSKNQLNLKILKRIEVICLRLLDYNCYLNGLKYENWCNILIIFGYDFIKCHNLVSNELVWESNKKLFISRLNKWKSFLSKLNLNNLDIIKINFNNYYLNQLGNKILLKNTNSSPIPSLFNTDNSNNKRRNCDDVHFNPFINNKKLKL